MTPQEKELLESLASRIAETQVPQKDAEADALIRQKIGSKPDALYVLTQTVLIQEMALNQANERLHDLQNQIDSHRGDPAPQQPVSFLGRLFGAGAPGPRYSPAPPQYADPRYQQPIYQQPGQGSSFLQSAAATATGVAAGALAFEGIESLFGHHGGGFGGGDRGEFLGGGGDTIINNYYDQPADDSPNTSDASFDDSDSSSSSDDDFSSTDV